MRRLQLFEFGDQPWLPAVFRNGIRRYLAAVWTMMPLPCLWAERLIEILAETGYDRIVDLGSGSGGPAPAILRELRGLGWTGEAILTDLYPDRHSGLRDAKLGIEYWPKAVNAAQVPSCLAGVRTMFACFHHFPPATARSILRNAFIQREPICLFEMTSRTLLHAVSTLLVPLAVLAITPRARPLSALQILFTYLVPLLPLLIAWDAFVSQLRTYSPQDLRAMTAGFAADDYQWEYGEVRVPRLLGAVPYLIGCPTGKSMKTVSAGRADRGDHRQEK